VQLVEPPDGVALVVAYLEEQLAGMADFEGIPVAGSLPATSPDYAPPGAHIVIRDTGGLLRDVLVSRVQLTITCWASAPDEELRAFDIARRVLLLLQRAERVGFLAGTPCTRVYPFGLPYNDPDAVTGRARYSVTVEIDLRGRAVRL